MRWRDLFILAALFCATVVLLRGALTFDGWSLLAVLFALAAMGCVWAGERS